MSLVAHLRMIPAPAYFLSVGLLLNSSIFYGNLGASLVGVVPIITEKLGRSGLGPKDKVRIWNLFYGGADTYMIPAILSTTTLHLLAAYFTSSSRVRNLALTAAGASLSLIPHTVLRILPIDRVLQRLGSKADLTSSEERDVVAYLDEWSGLHKWRFGHYAVSWTAGLGALLAVVGRWWMIGRWAERHQGLLC